MSEFDALYTDEDRDELDAALQWLWMNSPPSESAVAFFTDAPVFAALIAEGLERDMRRSSANAHDQQHHNHNHENDPTHLDHLPPHVD